MAYSSNLALIIFLYIVRKCAEENYSLRRSNLRNTPSHNYRREVAMMASWRGRSSLRPVESRFRGGGRGRRHLLPVEHLLQRVVGRQRGRGRRRRRRHRPRVGDGAPVREEGHLGGAVSSCLPLIWALATMGQFDLLK